ncbi:hypothetical protein JCM3766R1_004541 [Sporobolomyces carnicolor]
MASHSSVPVDPKGFEAYLLSDLTNHLSLLEVKALHDAAITASIKLKAEHDGVNERLDGLDTLLKKVTAATRRRNKRESQKEYSEAFRKWRSSYIRLVRRCGDGTDAVQCATNALHDMLELIDPDKGQGGQEMTNRYLAATSMDVIREKFVPVLKIQDETWRRAEHCLPRLLLLRLDTFGLPEAYWTPLKDEIAGYVGTTPGEHQLDRFYKAERALRVLRALIDKEKPAVYGV